MKKKSEFLKLKSKDFWEGLVMASFSSAASSIGTALAMVTNLAEFKWNTLIAAFAIGFGIGLSGYLSTHLFTNSDGDMLKKEVK